MSNFPTPCLHFSRRKNIFENMEESKLDLNVKIKQEKPSPERKIDDNEDELDKILNSKIFSETDEKKELEPAK